MSLSNALSNAVSGIVAASRGTEVVASNLANALTPGFARRELQLTTRPHVSAGGGVHVEGVTRVVHNSILAQGRVASAGTQSAATLQAFHKGLADAVGVPGEAGALTTLLADFDAALVSAAARPDSETGLGRVVTTAQALARSYNALGAQVQEARLQADKDIARDVQALNTGLARIVELNRQITVQISTGDDAGALQDARQQLIDTLSQIVPIQELPRDGGRVALYTASGGVLLDGFVPVDIGFSATSLIGPAMEVGTPPLGRLSIDGKELSASQMSMFGGGRLAANFQIRDAEAPAAQARLDAAARDLVERFSDPAVDGSLGGGPGLFTDDGNALDTANERGLAQRLSINGRVDPATGGGVWRLRDGMGASAAGPVGQSALLNRMHDVLAEQRRPPSSGMTDAERSAALMAADVTSLTAVGRMQAEGTLSTATARSESYDRMLRQDGVDSDREMETLLALERAYASNAKVLAAVDEMIQTILRMT